MIDDIYKPDEYGSNILVGMSAVPNFKKANWVTLGPYARWKAEVATPAFRQYLGNQISMDQLSKTLIDGWNNIRG